MKLLVLTDGYPPYHLGGAEVVAASLCREYVWMGHSVTVVTTMGDAGTVRELEEEDDGVRVIRVASRYHERWRAYVSLFNPGPVRAVRRVLAEVRPDAVHAHNVHAHLSYGSLLAVQRVGVPWILTYHDAMSFDYGKCIAGIASDDLSPRPGTRDMRVSTWTTLRRYRTRVFPLRTPIIRRVVRRASACISVSQALMDLLRANAIRCDGVIHNGVRPDSLTTSEVHPVLQRIRSEGGRAILFVGRLSPLKGSDQLLRAMATVAGEVPGAKLVCVGRQDSGWEEFRRRAVHLGLDEILVCTGWVPHQEMPSVYAGSDVLAVPSIYVDPFPTVVLEAMVCGLPVVATCFGGAKELVLDGRTGYVVNPLDMESLARAIVRLLKEVNEAKAMGSAGRERVEASFTLEGQAQRYLSLFGTVRTGSSRK